VGKNDENFCQSALDSNACDCQGLITPEGRAACGLAFPLSDGGP